MVRDGLRFAVGFALVVAMPMTMFGVIPWTVFLALIGVEIWRRRRHLQRVAGNPELLAADRQSQVFVGIAALAALGFVVLTGAAVALGSDALALLALVVMAVGFVLFFRGAIRSGSWSFMLCAAVMAIATIALFLRQAFEFS